MFKLRHVCLTLCLFLPSTIFAQEFGADEDSIIISDKHKEEIFAKVHPLYLPSGEFKFFAAAKQKAEAEGMQPADRHNPEIIVHLRKGADGMPEDENKGDFRAIYYWSKDISDPLNRGRQCYRYFMLIYTGTFTVREAAEGEKKEVTLRYGRTEITLPVDECLRSGSVGGSSSSGSPK